MLHDRVMLRGEMADGVGRGGIARQRQSLAATAAEVDVLALEGTAPARLDHPLGAAVAIEGVGLEPDLPERPLTHVVEGEPRNRRGRLAWQTLAARRDEDRVATPSAHARLR